MATVLTSWKAIAQYMGTGVRTVQRWSTERGFPVRGTGNGHKRLVIAMTEEIDEWVHSQSLHTSEAKGQSESEGEETLQEKIASLQSEIGSLRLHIDVMRMRKEIDENQLESSEDVLLRSARLLQQSSLLQQERRDIVDRFRSMRGGRADDTPLTLSLHNDSYPKQKASTREGKNLEINPVFLNKDQSAASAVLQAYPSPSLEDDPEYPDSADVAPDQLNAAPPTR